MSKWIRELSPKDKKYGDGRCGDLDRCYRLDRKHIVMTQLTKTNIGVVEHFCIRNRDNTDISWSEKQKIKNDIAGRKRTAIEVFPSEDRLIDEAGMYALNVFIDRYYSKEEYPAEDWQTLIDGTTFP